MKPMYPLYLALIGCILLLCLSATAQAEDSTTCLSEFSQVAVERLKYDLDRAMTDMEFQMIEDKYRALKYEAIQLCRGI